MLKIGDLVRFYPNPHKGVADLGIIIAPGRIIDQRGFRLDPFSREWKVCWFSITTGYFKGRVLVEIDLERYLSLVAG